MFDSTCASLSHRAPRDGGHGLLVCKAKAIIQVWGYTQTPTGNRAETTRYKEPEVGYVRRDGLETAFD